MTELTPELLLNAYANGYFPMADSRASDTIRWYSPELRGIIPLEGTHIPKRLVKLYKKKPYKITMNQAFHEVITHCANTPRGDNGTWINHDIISTYTQLHYLGFAHSIEIWENNELVGGLYGVCLGKAFFGESMFSIVPNASKLALVYLMEWMKENDFTLLDTQYANEHLKQFGIIEISRDEYLEKLNVALAGVMHAPQ